MNTRKLSSNSSIDIDDFFTAAKNGSADIIKNLAPKTLNIRDNRGWTLLMHGCRHGHFPVIQHLIEANCDIEVKNITGQTAREIALFWKNSDIAGYIEQNTTKTEDDEPLFFSANPLERHSELRANDSWVYSTIQKTSTKYILMYKSQPIVVANEEHKIPGNKLLECSILDVHELLKNEGQNLIFLGIYPGDDISSTTTSFQNREEITDVPWFAIDVSHVDMKDVKKIDQTAEPMSILPGLLQMSGEYASIVAQAIELTDWHFRYKFCPTCGTETFLSEAGYKRICKDPSCLSHTGVYNTNYPRIDPTVITAILTPDRDYCLLGRKRAFPPGMFSCVAGFIEPGESVESACVREVKEEVGVTVNHIEYVASQPWPRQSGLMLGLHAICTSKTDIKLVDRELEEARWFSREEAAEMLTFTHKDKLYIPPPQAIAHHLVKKWVLQTA